MGVLALLKWNKNLARKKLMLYTAKVLVLVEQTQPIKVVNLSATERLDITIKQNNNKHKDMPKFLK